MDFRPTVPVDAAWLLVGGWIGAIVVASGINPSGVSGSGTESLFGVGLPLGLGGLGIDVTVWLHFGAYAVLAWLTARAAGSDDARTALFALVVASGVGLAIEAMQATIPARTASVGDAVVNAAGAGLGVAWRRVTSALRRGSDRDR
ncbi:MAG: VanZ family protein [Halobellus sp.]|uniref:VanZ family protein n=1 Tax=Halobellus sp. TaxID=1979212 RepID=UPI0035D45C14